MDKETDIGIHRVTLLLLIGLNKYERLCFHSYCCWSKGYIHFVLWLIQSVDYISCSLRVIGNYPQNISTHLTTKYKPLIVLPVC